MRHSRRLSSHPNQPQGPFCSHCGVNLSTFPAYIRCADPACRNIPICIDCFSVGAADVVPHRPNHPYRVIERLAQPIYASDWAAHEELRLLEALSEHGPHHWKAVADYVGKTQRKCELHYENVYLKSPNAPFATSTIDDDTPAGSPAASTDGLDEGDAPDGKPVPDGADAGNKRKLKDKDSERESGTLEGFMPLRGDFDVEWDDKAEELISDLVIDPTDTSEERELKTKLLLMYDDRLQRRNVVKEFLFDRKLLDFAELKYHDRRGTRDEKELSARLQVFSRLLSKPEFDAFYSSVMTEYRISRDVYRMTQARKAGIRTRKELDIYEVERKARCQRLGEQAREKGKERAVEKRMRSSVLVDSPAPTSTPLNSVPGTPGSPVMSPSKATPPGDGASPDGQSERNSVNVRKARERKRIARSPYPTLEALPVDDMEDAWKLSQTEKKLCSALRIPPADFLRMRDAMLYTGTQNVKRRGRPRKRGSNTPVLTIRAKRQRKDNTPPSQRRAKSKTPEPSLVLNTVPLSTLQQQQQVTLRQTNVTPTADFVPRVTLACKPPVNVPPFAMPSGLENGTPCQGESSNHKLRLSLNVEPHKGQKPLSSVPTTTALTHAAIGGLVDSEDLPLSATFAVPSQQQRALRPPLAASEIQDNQENAVAIEQVDIGEGREADTKEDTRVGTAGSDVSCEDDLIEVTALARPRPVTRSFAKLSKVRRERVTTRLTRVSRSNSPFEGPKQADAQFEPSRTVLSVSTLKIRRPVTRARAVQMQSTPDGSDSEQNMPTSKSTDEDVEVLDAGNKSVVHTTLEYRVPRKRAHCSLASANNSHDVQDANMGDEDGQLAELPNEESVLVKPSKLPEDDVSSKDEVDEVLCGEDGAGNWSTDTRVQRQAKPGIVPHADELLDQGRASVDSTPGRAPQRLAKKEPKSPGKTSQRAPKQQLDISGRTPQRLAKKQPRQFEQPEPSQKENRNVASKRTIEPKDKDMESKETEVTIDGDGECRGKGSIQLTGRKIGRSNEADSVEILSGGEGDSESVEKNADEFEEVTLDEGQDDGVEDVKDATWTPQEADLGDVGQDGNEAADSRDDVSLENPACQTELGTEPGTPDTSFQEGEFRECIESNEMADDRRRTRGATQRNETLPVRKSSRVQKRSRRFEESVEASTQPVKRRRTGAREDLTSAAHKSPANITRACTVITSQVGDGVLDDIEEIDAEAENVSKRFMPHTQSSRRKSIRQNTHSKARYPMTERRVTRSAGRQTRSRSAGLKNRSVADRSSLRRG